MDPRVADIWSISAKPPRRGILATPPGPSGPRRRTSTCMMKSRRSSPGISPRKPTARGWLTSSREELGRGRCCPRRFRETSPSGFDAAVRAGDDVAGQGDRSPAQAMAAAAIWPAGSAFFRFWRSMCSSVLGPSLATFYYSLTDWNGLGPATYIGLQNYRDLSHDQNFREASGTSSSGPAFS